MGDILKETVPERGQLFDLPDFKTIEHVEKQFEHLQSQIKGSTIDNLLEIEKSADKMTQQLLKAEEDRKKAERKLIHYKQRILKKATILEENLALIFNHYRSTIKTGQPFDFESLSLKGLKKGQMNKLPSNPAWNEKYVNPEIMIVTKTTENRQELEGIDTTSFQVIPVNKSLTTMTLPPSAAAAASPLLRMPRKRKISQDHVHDSSVIMSNNLSLSCCTGQAAFSKISGPFSIFPCGCCEITFTCRDALSKHEATTHPTLQRTAITTEPVVICVQLASLASSPHCELLVCRFCGAQFPQRASYNNHIKACRHRNKFSGDNLNSEDKNDTEQHVTDSSCVEAFSTLMDDLPASNRGSHNVITISDTSTTGIIDVPQNSPKLAVTRRSNRGGGGARKRTAVVEEHKQIFGRKCSCEKSFKSNKKLKRHLNYHKHSGNYQCVICKVLFATGTTLRLHEMRVHNEQTTLNKNDKMEQVSGVVNTSSNITNTCTGTQTETELISHSSQSSLQQGQDNIPTGSSCSVDKTSDWNESLHQEEPSSVSENKESSSDEDGDDLTERVVVPPIILSRCASDFWLKKK